ncbi:DUF4350 domain-containing protein [Microbacterium tumbae]
MTVAVERPSTAASRRRPWRRWAGWLMVVALVIGGALLAMRMTSAVAEPFRGALDPESAGDSGALAFAEILRDQGVDVQIARSRTEAAAAVRDDTTLVMTDPYALSDEAVQTLIAPADDVIILSASSRMLDLLDLGEDSWASTLDAVPASCDLPELARVGTIRPERLFTPADGVTGCFADADGNAALLVADRDGVRTALIDAPRLLNNAYLAENGNAALGLALLGQTGHVVWYVPSFLDSDLEAQGEPSLGDLTPGWVTPAILLLMLALIAAGIWRGRRFGPLVAETLPVTVRASETMHGRARLTAKTADAAHAADAIREGAIRRLARRLGLHDRATPIEVADAAADRLRVPRPAVVDLLAGPVPQDDDALIDAARRLSDLEAAVEATIRSERSTP